MINLLSIRCSLAFAPYLARALSEFVDSGSSPPLVVRQGGNGLEARVAGREDQAHSLIVRHESREDRLDAHSATHYQATIDCRSALFDVRRMSDEVVVANTPDGVLVSYPQSQLFLEPAVAAAVVESFRAGDAAAANCFAVPDWLVMSASGDRILLSDQRNGRWVLLAAEHIDYLESAGSDSAFVPADRRHPRAYCPAVTVKGIEVPMISVFRVAEALEGFAATGKLTTMTEVTPDATIGIGPAVEGIELRDSSHRVGLNAREASKWASIIRSEIERLNAAEFERGCIRTVVANSGEGRWLVQGGDHIHAGTSLIDECRRRASAVLEDSPVEEGGLFARRSNDRMLILSRATGHCVALAEPEVEALLR